MAVGMTHEVGEQLTDVFARGGLRVVSIDSRVCALGRCAGLASLMHDATSVDGLTGIVDLGYSRAQLVMLHMRGVTPDVANPHDPADNAPGPRVAYERTIEAGGLTRLLQLIRTRLGLDTEAAIALLQGDGEHRPSAGVDELLRATRGMVSEYFDSFLAEVQRSMHYAAQRYPSVPLRSVWVCGPGSQVRGISEKLESLVQIPVRQLTPQKCFSIRVGSVLGSDPHVMIACGLASGVLSKPVKVLEMQHQESQSKAKEARAEAVAERSAS
jgi:Tfp pilus assembly PilM family ATPase